jgi:pilus assembly protein Flp/PilA
MLLLVRRFLADENGASAIEYGLIASLISVTLIAVLVTLGINLRDMAMEIVDALREVVE